MKKTIFIFFICILAGGLFFVFKGDFFKNKSSERYVGQPENITIANIGEFSIFHLIAHEKKYFDENGIHATIIEYPSGPAAVTDLLAGKVDAAVAADFVGVRTIFNDKRLRILSELSKHETFHMVARKDKGIQNPKDIKGKKIGVTTKGVGEFFLGRFLSLNGLSLNDITLVDLAPVQLIQAIKEGTLDAVVIFDPHAYSLKKELRENAIVWPAQGGQRTLALLYSTDAFIKVNPYLIERYMKALLQAEQFLMENEEEAKSILSKSMKYEREYIDHIWSRFEFTIRLDQALLLIMEDQAQWVIANNLTDEKKIPNYLNSIYFEGLNKVKPERVLIIR